LEANKCFVTQFTASEMEEDRAGKLKDKVKKSFLEGLQQNQANKQVSSEGDVFHTIPPGKTTFIDRFLNNCPIFLWLRERSQAGRFCIPLFILLRVG
jgi:hypothetical protein